MAESRWGRLRQKHGRKAIWVAIAYIAWEAIDAWDKVLFITESGRWAWLPETSTLTPVFRILAILSAVFVIGSYFYDRRGAHMPATVQHPTVVTPTAERIAQQLRRLYPSPTPDPALLRELLKEGRLLQASYRPDSGASDVGRNEDLRRWILRVHAALSAWPNYRRHFDVRVPYVPTAYYDASPELYRAVGILATIVDQVNDELSS